MWTVMQLLPSYAPIHLVNMENIKALGLFYWAKKKYSDGTFFTTQEKRLIKI